MAPHINGTFQKATDADKPAALKKLCSDAIPAGFKRLTKLLGGMKFICGANITQYDF